jgi:signal transduction histidine kinase
VPIRQLTVPADSTQGRFFVQVVQDRTLEAQTLGSLVIVLVVGGLVVVLVAVGFGALYASRALVPIRDSLAGQRVALRRQREFAADASHELRTPLTVIRSSVELLRRNAAKPVAEVPMPWSTSTRRSSTTTSSRPPPARPLDSAVSPSGSPPAR